MNDQARVAALTLDAVERRYGRADTTVEVLNGASLELLPGQSVALIAPSGAGKSTLLHLAGLLERPDAGEVQDRGRRDLDHERRQADGAQAHGHRLRLPVPSFAAGVLCAREPRPAADDRGAAARPGRRPRARAARLSRSRCSARAIAQRNCPAANSSVSPSRARSPTARGCCWPTSRPAISTRRPPTTCSARLPRWSEASGLAALVATHNMDLAARMDRRVTIRDGQVSEMA